MATRFKNCKLCTESFTDASRQNRVKYCSKLCKKKFNARKVERSKNCQYCDVSFEDVSRFNSTGFCSDVCLKENANLKRYKIPKDLYLKLLKIKNCQLCDKLFYKRADQHIDHCHVTSKVRGVLCRTCNVSLGGLGDTIEGLLKAIKYLENP